jgi:hypothetical protein
MGVVPNTVSDRIAWYQARQTTWTSNSVALGMSAGEMTTMSGYITAAAAALTAQTVAKNAAKAATLILRDADRIMARYGSDLIKQIRAKAGQVGGDSVYALALVPPPAIPSPVPAPGTPTDFVATLNQDGSLNLNWKCANPIGSGGTTYQVFRKIGTATTFSFIGASGTKSLTDATLPSPIAAVTYQIMAVRSTAMGMPAQFLVNFGGGGSLTTMAIVENAPKLAA